MKALLVIPAGLSPFYHWNRILERATTYARLLDPFGPGSFGGCPPGHPVLPKSKTLLSHLLWKPCWLYQQGFLHFKREIWDRSLRSLREARSFAVLTARIETVRKLALNAKSFTCSLKLRIWGSGQILVTIRHGMTTNNFNNFNNSSNPNNPSKPAVNAKSFAPLSARPFPGLLWTQSRSAALLNWGFEDLARYWW